MNKEYLKFIHRLKKYCLIKDADNRKYVYVINSKIKRYLTYSRKNIPFIKKLCNFQFL